MIKKKNLSIVQSPVFVKINAENTVGSGPGVLNIYQLCVRFMCVLLHVPVHVCVTCLDGSFTTENNSASLSVTHQPQTTRANNMK